ncbi:hypothetical protein [Saccharopolyspora sp. SCSIO 74807]|uniref:hypothetical protein n=1 Tax=Saccharopolyspora sp. SCSIO 74807 TaxID=3118084 RepID=UPI0030D2B748
MLINEVVRVRYRLGLVGEARRTVHVATATPGELYRTLCELVMRADDVEVFDRPAGAPCMFCTRALALGSESSAGQCDEVVFGSTGWEIAR